MYMVYYRWQRINSHLYKYGGDARKKKIGEGTTEADEFVITREM